jgi:hypothetical protein
MELNELKSVWAQFDKKLTENLKLNEEVLKRVCLNKSKSELRIPIYYELVNSCGLFLVMVYVAIASIRLINQLQFCIPGFVSILIVLVYLIFAIIKAIGLLKIDYYHSTIVGLQSEIARLRILVLRLRKIEFACSLPLILSLLPILFKSVSNIDIYSNIRLLTIELILIVSISFPLTYWMNKYLYDKKINEAENHIKDINRFKSGG